MDNALFSDIYEHDVPQFNSVITEGYATHELPKAPDYIGKVWRCAYNDLPADYVYNGWEMANPYDVYEEITRRKRRGRQYEIAPTTTYMVRYKLDYQGKPLRKQNMFMPYSTAANIIKLRGAVYDVSPVMTDKAISVGIDHIFIPVTRAKIKFERLVQHFVVNCELQQEYVIWAPLYKRPKPEKGQIKPVIGACSTLGHYLFCKYGVSETFGRFARTQVSVGFADQINETNYPADEWLICETQGIKPPALGKVMYYYKSEIKLAIRKRDWNPFTKGLIASFFYVADFFPSRIHPEDIDDIRLWRALMGHIVIATNENEGKLVEGIDVHMGSLDNYIDELTKEDLLSDKIVVNDLYELMVDLIQTFSQRVLEDVSSVSSLYGKQLRVLRYTMLPIQKDIFYFLFDIKKRLKNNLSAQEINKIMNRLFKPDRIMKINYGHAEVKPISLACDNYALGITCKVVPQAESTAGAGEKKSSMTDPNKLVDVSLAEAGGHLNLPKSEPSGRSRLNPFVRLSPEGLILRKDHLRKIVDKTHLLLRS